MYVVLGVAFYWLIMAIVVHNLKDYDWKKSFLVAPVYIVWLFFAEFFGDGNENDE